MWRGGGGACGAEYTRFVHRDIWLQGRRPGFRPASERWAGKKRLSKGKYIKSARVNTVASIFLSLSSSSASRQYWVRCATTAVNRPVAG